MTDVDRLEKLKNLSPEKYALLLKALQEDAGTSTTISRRPQQSPAPLSFVQERLWFLNQLTPDDPSYNMSTATRLKGPLNVGVLEQSLNQVIRRHEALRTTFVNVEGQPFQIIAPELHLALPTVDLRGLVETERESKARQLATEEAQTPFDLVRGPLLRTTLLWLDENDYVLFLTTHHIVSDGWSMGVLLREIVALYDSLSNAGPSPLPDLPIQYADFAIWQRNQLQDGALEAHLAYWKRQLAGSLPVLELPTDWPRPAFQTFRGGHQMFELPKWVYEELEALSRQEDATLFMTLLAAFKTLLYRYTGQEDIIVGLPIAGRNRPETENLIGFFVNTLVLRADLSGNPVFRELLSQVRKIALESYAHQDLSFARLVEELQLERDPGRNPLFQVMFALQNAPAPPLECSDLNLSPLEGVETGVALFDLSLDMWETEKGLSGVLEYNADLFAPATITRMAGHLKTLLVGITADPDQRISNLPILTEEERHQLLVEWNDTHVDFPEVACIHHVFESQVEQTPDATAVVCPPRSPESILWDAAGRTEHREGQVLTYGALNRRANQLAHYLIKMGVGPEVLVGICVERSLEMVVGVLAILKAGGAHVPLDPTYPRERLAFILKDAQPLVLVTQSQVAESLPEHAARTVCLDRGWDVIAQENEENPASRVKPGNLAYAIYTSGSTGRPKGAMIAHSSLVNAYFAWDTAYPLRFGTCSHLQTASLAFDVFTGDIVRALCFGAKMVLCPKDWLLDPARIYELMCWEKIDYAEFVPALARNLVQYLKDTRQSLDYMRLLIVGSDMWYVSEHKALFDYCGPGARIIDSYGLTEITVDSTYFEGDDSDLEDTSGGLPVPIGRPFPNTQVYVLDHYLQPTPLGVPGELHIGSPGLARGFLNRPDLTASRFIPNPFSDEPGARLYKTGDLARYLPDGNVVLLGRVDRQAKIRGFRIELGEVETVLGEHPMVQDAVALVREDVPGDKRLVAYVVPEQAQTPKSSELHAFMKQSLPAYMVPSAFVTLEAIPLTPNGKVDRQALPKPDRTGLARTYVAPRDNVEQTVAAIWQELLGAEQVSVHDDFFELGGHSLLAARLVFQLREVFHIEFPMRSLFEAPTVAELAKIINLIHQEGLSAVAAATDEVDLEAEVVLDSNISPDAVPTLPGDYIAGPSAVFLTGATGFLGAHLLYELLQKTQADIYCLVRASNVEEGRTRLEGNLASYLLWDDSLSARIVPVVGDLSQSSLGLSEQQFRTLAGRIDGIYHCGAWVNFTYPYHALKGTNVLGTQEVLRLASQIRVKPVHFISTLSVFDSAVYAGGEIIREDDELEHSEGLYGGYPQSKWVAEKLVMVARSRGIPACIYRLGFLGGHSQTGVTNTRDFIWCMVKGCIQLGSIPDTGSPVDVTPVDYVSRAIVHLSRQRESLGKAFHIFNPHRLPWSDLVNWIHAAGYPLERMPYKQWQANLLDAVEYSPDNALIPFIPLFSDLPSEGVSKEQPSDQADGRRFDCQNVLDGLANTSIVCPPVDTKLLDVYLSYLTHAGFLDAPAPTSGL